MVFVKRDIPSSQALVPWEATEIPKDKLLQVTNQVNMAGMMSQFTLLMTYSHEVFAGLLDEANETFGRLKDLGQRVGTLQSSLPGIEKSFDGDEMAVLTRLNSTGASRYLAANPERQDLFGAASMPSAVKAVRGQCFPPPALHLLDPFRGEEDHTPTLAKYSNPLFFLEQWAAEQQAKTDELRAERKKKRAERVARRAERDAQQVQTTKPVRKLKKIRYDPQTGQRIVEDDDDSTASTPVSARPIAHSQPASNVAAPVAQAQPVSTATSNSQNSSPSLPPPVTSEPAHTGGSALPPPVPEKKGSHAKKEKTKTKEKEKESHHKTKGDKRPKEDAPAPPGPVDLPPAVAAPPPPPVAHQHTSSNDFPAGIAAPPPPPINNTAPVPPPIPVAVGGGPAPPPPPPPIVGGGPAPPPPPPMNTGGGDTSDLMASIRGGAAVLKKNDGPVAGAIEKPVDQRSNLMENIRAGLKLKSASDRPKGEVNPQKAGGAPSSVAEILARRIAIEPDSDDDVDDDNDDWSD